MTVRVEWRVSGHPTLPMVNPVSVVFGGPFRHDALDGEDAEVAARSFLAMTVHERWGWADGPHLERRVVTEMPWERAS